MDERIYSKNIIEFVTVSAEYCAFIERTPELEKEEFVDKIIKILPLLYLKATLLSPEEPEEESYPEKFVTENIYESIRIGIESLLGEEDSYLEVFQTDMKYSEEPLAASISEGLADIYQDLKDFISVLKINVGMSFVGSIMGEYLTSKAGLGYLIVYGGQIFKIDLVMSATFILCILAYLLYAIVSLIEKKYRN